MKKTEIECFRYKISEISFFFLVSYLVSFIVLLMSSKLTTLQNFSFCCLTINSAGFRWKFQVLAKFRCFFVEYYRCLDVTLIKTLCSHHKVIAELQLFDYAHIPFKSFQTLYSLYHRKWSTINSKFSIWFSGYWCRNWERGT